MLKALVFALLALTLMGCATNPGPPQGNNTAKMQVVTSFRPFTLLVAPVAGDDAQITQVLPPGADPHDYEPTPADAIKMQDAKVFFYDGPFLEPWGATLPRSANPDIKVVSFADAVPPGAIERMKAAHSGFPDTSQDPHLWLSPKLALYFVTYAAAQLSDADPAHSSDYQANAKAFEGRLQKLDGDYQSGLANCTTRTLLTSHAFLDYVAADYNLTAISIAGLSPDAEPSIAQMGSVLNESRAAGVMGVLAEPDESQTLSESVGSELKLPVYYFTTMEVLPSGNLSPADDDYVAIGEKNLQQLRLALGCR